MRRIFAWLLLSAVCVAAGGGEQLKSNHSSSGTKDRSPVDLVLTSDGQYLLTANQTSDSVSLVRVSDGAVLCEEACGRRPTALAFTPDGKRVLVTASYSGDLSIFDLQGEKLARVGDVRLGFEPYGIAISPDSQTAFVALKSTGAIALVNLREMKVESQIPVGHWPRYLALSPDGKRLAVGLNGEGGVAVVDVLERKKLFTSLFMGLNIGHMQCSSDGQYAYFPFMAYGDRPITPGNIRQGWVMANRIARVRLDELARREALALDPRGLAIADPHGIAISPDEQWIVTTAAGSQELIVFRLPALAFDQHGPGDHIDPALANDDQRFYRVTLGGRPMAVRFAADGKSVFVANYMSNSVQQVDLVERRVVRTIELGSAAEQSLARRGEAIFYDARRSLDQWYSCHSCHYEGGTNMVTMDTRGDNTTDTYKTVLSLHNVKHTGPWSWHGIHGDLATSLRKSLKDSMQGPDAADDDVETLVAFLETLAPPPNPHRQPDGSLSSEAQRGREIFESQAAGCANCHNGSYFTDGQVHDVGLSNRRDAFKTFNTPSLVGVYDRVRLLHDGRARSLGELLTGPHSPEKVSGTRKLEPAELADLIAYLKTL